MASPQGLNINPAIFGPRPAIAVPIPVTISEPAICAAIALAIEAPRPVNFNNATAAMIVDSIGATSTKPFHALIAAMIASNISVPILDRISIKSISFINVPIFSPIIVQSVPCTAFINVVSIPFIHLLAVSAASSNLNVEKNVLIPSAMDNPKLSHLKLSPKLLRTYNAVFNALAIVNPKTENVSGVIRPFKNVAKPVPKLLAFSYIASQSILPSASCNFLPKSAPRL